MTAGAAVRSSGPATDPSVRSSAQPKIKVCGVTRSLDVERSLALGADYLGLNFYPPSPRNLDLEMARRLAEVARGRALLVGVFVNRPLDEIRRIDEAVGLDLVQLHGEESPETVAAFPGRAIKAFRVDAEAIASCREEPEGSAARDAWAAPLRLGDYADAAALLFDVRHPRLYGGTGEGWPYEALGELALEAEVFVAGGVGPGTARRAAAASRAQVLDVCSGVESAPGIKDPDQLQRLFEEVRHGQSPGTS